MCNRWAVPVTMGVDVGGPAKGFDVAVIDGRRVVELCSRCSRDDVLGLAGVRRPDAIGIDSPAGCAPPGEKSRAGERALASEVCPIFYTPQESVVRSGHPFYRWMVEGFSLYEGLAAQLPGVPVTEVFPSAAWTVWAGKREGRSKARWSAGALRKARLQGVPSRLSQDARDALGAALVAALYLRGETEDFGGIAVPRAGSVALLA